VGVRANHLADAVAMARSPAESLENDEVERALEELESRQRRVLGHVPPVGDAWRVGCSASTCKRLYTTRPRLNVEVGALPDTAAGPMTHQVRPNGWPQRASVSVVLLPARF